MLDSQPFPNDGPDPGGLALEQPRPSGIGVDKHDAAVQWLRFSDMGGANLFVGPAVSQLWLPTPDYSLAVAKSLPTTQAVPSGTGAYRCMLVFIQTTTKWQKHLSEHVGDRVIGGAARPDERAGSARTS